MQASAPALDIKLWPLIDYRRDSSGQRRLDLLGPLFSYTSGPDAAQLVVRPLFAFTRGRASERRLSILYPLFVSRWGPEDREYRLLELVSYRTGQPRQPDQSDRRFTIFPIVFYRHSRALGTQLSVLPFYADLRDFLGYERVQMVLFPLYLRLQKPLVERTWMPFPFVSWSGGTLGRGVRVFPFYGWDQEGESERSEYVMWPFYVSRERHFTRADRERHLILYPFYSSIDSPTQQSRSYAFPFFLPFLSHTIDRTQRRETWGYPWPAWLTQRNLDTGERTALRLAPFYEDTHFGDRHAHFILWPAYRWSTQESDSYRYDRSDSFWVLYRNTEEVQPGYHRHRRLHTLFPLYRASEEDADTECSTPALLDALMPSNATIQQLYAPLWQLYSAQREDDGPRRWTLLWGLISSDGTGVRYPVHLAWTE